MSLASPAATAAVISSTRLSLIVPRRWSLFAFKVSSGPSLSSGCDTSRLRSGCCAAPIAYPQ
jgi:hypothetical protein